MARKKTAGKSVLHRAKSRLAAVGEKVAPGITIGKVLPSLITLCSTMCGMSAILWASRGYFGRAVLLIMLAAILDALDGGVARLLKASSQFGVELDSLSDAISFGVAPAFVMYYFSAHHVKAFGWLASVMLAVACVLRLARFNIMTGDRKTPEYWKKFFVGTPAPMGGLMAMYPITLFFATGEELFMSPQVGIAFLVACALLMISRIPTIALKKVRLPGPLVPYVLVALTFTLALMFYHFWRVLAAIGIVYALSIPLSILLFLRARRQARTAQ
ncbi:MAG: CDP-diacylglycerol--serine O-phosphatidyltransferase [Rickettsiales bacterium]|jgi:CDP-diacylglycerol--serine O-phosphatidyltransferase|nr:CDP-diacylglycerol--serine O-phosphatidyltransferase [Rickettsiales bacterium]